MSIAYFSPQTRPNVFFPQRKSALLGNPATLRAQKDRLDIRFGTTEQTHFPAQAMEIIQSTLQQCHYGQDLEYLLKPESGFKVINNAGEVVLINYHSRNQAEPPFKGICNDLALQVGRFLEKKLGSDFVVKAALGSCDQYFHQSEDPDLKKHHIYLLAWPKSQDIAVSSALQQSKTYLPKGCLLIDPSFKHTAQDLRGYYLDSVKDLQALEADFDSKYFPLPKNVFSCSVPMGLVKDVIPEKAHLFGPKALLHLSFMLLDPARPLILPAVQPNVNSSKCEPDTCLTSDLPNTHPFQQFIQRIREDLEKPESEQISARKAYEQCKQSDIG